MIPDFLAANSHEIVTRARAKIATRSTPQPTEEGLTTGIPLFLCRIHRPAAPGHARQHGDRGERHTTRHRPPEDGVHREPARPRLRRRLQAVTELAEAMNASITTDEFHTLT